MPSRFTPVGLGILTKGGSSTALIDAGTPMPASRAEVFTTADSNQASLAVKLLMGDSQLAAENELVAEIEFAPLPVAAPGVLQLRVTFDIDDDGAIRVSNLDLGYNRVIPMRVGGQSIVADTVLGNLFGTALPAHAASELPGHHAAETTGPAPALIFLSYASADRERVRPLVSYLENSGFNVFWDRGIPPGQDPMEFLGTKLAECHCVLVVWTATSVISRYVRNEALHGYDADKLLPVRLDDVVPPFPFTNVQAADLSDWTGDPSSDGIRALVGEIARLARPRTV